MADTVKAPSLEELRTRPCTLEELQAKLIEVIDAHNEQGRRMAAAINRLNSRDIVFK